MKGERFFVGLGLCLFCLCGSFSALAKAQDGMAWLGRVAAAAYRLNYEGIFVYRQAAQSETIRIAHRFEAGRDWEYQEVLTGHPREVLRRDGEVRYYWPQKRLLIVEQASAQRHFPALFPVALLALSENYVLRLQGREQIVGRDAQIVWIEPRDQWRYGQQLWIDVASGLLLRADVLNERKEILESFAFSQLQIGGKLGIELFKSKFEAELIHWRVRHIPRVQENMRSLVQSENHVLWGIKDPIPGFRKLNEMYRPAQIDRLACQHLVFSDGLATVSVFIEKRPSQQTQQSSVSPMEITMSGAFNVYRRGVGPYQIVVMGDAPAMTLRKIGDGLEVRTK